MVLLLLSVVVVVVDDEGVAGGGSGWLLVLSCWLLAVLVAGRSLFIVRCSMSVVAPLVLLMLLSLMSKAVLKKIFEKAELENSRIHLSIKLLSFNFQSNCFHFQSNCFHRFCAK